MTVDDRDRDDADARASERTGTDAGETPDTHGEQCWNCGAALPEGAMFCGECGSAVGARAARPEPAASQPAESEQAGSGPGDSVPGDPEPADPEPADLEPPDLGPGDAGPDDPAPGRSADEPEGNEARPVDDAIESGTPPHGDALIDSAAGAGASAPPVAGADSPQPSADQAESGLPPHGDALIDSGDALSAAPDAGRDGAVPGEGDRSEGGASDEDTGDGDAGDDSHADDPYADDASDAGTDAPVGDSAPTAVQPVIDDGGGVQSPDGGGVQSPDDAGGDAPPPAGGSGFATEAREPADDESGDPLAPLTPEERFAAERLLDPDSDADKFVLQFSTGESATVYGSGLIGRNPVAEPGEYVDHLVVIRDPGRSVSKTHLEFGQDSGAFWVLDRFSGNGSALREPAGSPKRCEPGRRYFIARGTRIDIGDQFFVVS